MYLKKRANAKKEIVECEDEKGKREVKYTRFGYPGASKWGLKTACAQQAIDFKEEESCTTTEVVERQATADDLKPGPNNEDLHINSERSSAKAIAKDHTKINDNDSGASYRA